MLNNNKINIEYFSGFHYEKENSLIDFAFIFI